MTTHQLDEAIANQYDNGHYSPLGADGGALRYIDVIINDKRYWASITLDSDIAEVRRIWELSERNNDNDEVQKVYDLTSTYYSLR